MKPFGWSVLLLTVGLIALPAARSPHAEPPRPAGSSLSASHVPPETPARPDSVTAVDPHAERDAETRSKHARRPIERGDGRGDPHATSFASVTGPDFASAAMRRTAAIAGNEALRQRSEPLRL